MASDGLIVTDRVVHCWRTVRLHEERKAVVAAAALAPAVKTVKDHQEYPVVFTPM